MLPTALATDDFLKREVPRKNQRIFELLTGFCAAGDACVRQSIMKYLILSVATLTFYFSWQGCIYRGSFGIRVKTGHISSRVKISDHVRA